MNVLISGRWLPILALVLGSTGCIERFDDFSAGALPPVPTLDVGDADSGGADVSGAPADVLVHPGDARGDGLPVGDGDGGSDGATPGDVGEDSLVGDAADGVSLPDSQPDDANLSDTVEDTGATDVAEGEDGAVPDSAGPADTNDGGANTDVPLAADGDSADGDSPPDAGVVETCGDGVCSLTESCASCEADCGCGETEVCFDGACCAPNCAGRECGDDGCGGSCGVCVVGSACIGGLCMPGCGDGACVGLETCGNCPDDCACGTGAVCHEGACCAPDCTGKVCGVDGCGGTCGVCPTGTSCDQGACAAGCGDGLCSGPETCETCSADCACAAGAVCFVGACCVPSCEDKQCGADACGGTCGSCLAGQTCGEGQCVAICGDGTCDEAETCEGCPADCGACVGTCTPECGPYAQCDGFPGACVTKTVKIPAGSFYMGCNATLDPACQADEIPYHVVSVSTFGVEMTEATNGQFASFLNALANNGKDNLCPFEGSEHPCLITSTEAEIPAQTNGVWAAPKGAEDLPVVGVTWYGANSYCSWTGRRLCREAEWEKAARGGCELYTSCKNDSPLYPWGNSEPNCKLAVMDASGGPGCGAGGPGKVGSLPPSTGYGVHDLAGNAWEWAADWYGPTWYQASPATDPVGPTTAKARVRRGGGFADGVEALRVSKRAFAEPFKGDGSTGFRCCAPSCGNGVCEASIGETCATCPTDCGCSDGAVCLESACCIPTCSEGQCGDDGCGGACGACPVNQVCEPGGCKVYLAKPGDLVITELMARPATKPPALGEWFEITNTTGADLDLGGWVVGASALAGSQGGYHTVLGPLVIPAHGIVVFAFEGDPAKNGGIVPDYVYASPGDPSEIHLSESTYLSLVGPPQLEMFELIDEVFFDPDTFPTDSARSSSLDSAKTTASQNDDPASWCLSGTLLPGGSGFGTPGLPNDPCF